MSALVATRPVRVVTAAGPDVDKLEDLTVRRVGGSYGYTVFRHGERDVLRAAERPFFVIGCQRLSDDTFRFWKVSWHNTLDRAQDSLRRRRVGGGVSFAIVVGEVRQ